MMAYSREHRFILFVLEEDLPLFEFVQDAMEMVIVAEKYRPPVKNILWHQSRLPALARCHQPRRLKFMKELPGNLRPRQSPERSSAAAQRYPNWNKASANKALRRRRGPGRRCSYQRFGARRFN